MAETNISSKSHSIKPHAAAEAMGLISARNLGSIFGQQSCAIKTSRFQSPSAFKHLIIPAVVSRELFRTSARRPCSANLSQSL